VLSTPPAFVLSQDQTLQQNPDKTNKNKLAQTTKPTNTEASVGTKQHSTHC
jgi:hypothetical protein